MISIQHQNASKKHQSTTAELDENKQQREKEERDAANNIGMDDGDVVGDLAEHSCNILRVRHRIKDQLEPHESNSKGGNEEIWALIEYEIYNPDQPEPTMMIGIGGEPPNIVKKWKKFNTENDLSDFIRRDTGEPLTLPPYSLSVQQSDKIQDDAKASISQITEEFRRYRVKSEMARKQADAHIRELQSSKVETAKRRINEHGVSKKYKSLQESNKIRLGFFICLLTFCLF